MLISASLSQYLGLLPYERYQTFSSEKASSTDLKDAFHNRKHNIKYEIETLFFFTFIPNERLTVCAKMSADDIVY